MMDNDIGLRITPHVISSALIQDDDVIVVAQGSPMRQNTFCRSAKCCSHRG